MRRVSFRVLGIALVVLAGAAVRPCPTPAQTVTYSGAAQYASGEYIFSERTHSVYLSNGLDVSTDRLDLSVSVPIIFQSSPWVSYSLVGGIPSGGPQQRAMGGRHGAGSGGQGPRGTTMAGPAAERGDDPQRGRQPGETLVLPDTTSYTDVGVGDPSTRVDLHLLRDGPFPLGLSLVKQLGPWVLFGDAVYWWLGDMRDVVLQNAVAYSASVGRAFANGRLGLLASLSGYTSEIIKNVDPPLQAGLGLNYSRAQGKYGLNGSLTIGLTESNSDVSVGLGWHVQF